MGTMDAHGRAALYALVVRWLQIALKAARPCKALRLGMLLCIELASCSLHAECIGPTTTEGLGNCWSSCYCIRAEARCLRIKLMGPVLR